MYCIIQCTFQYNPIYFKMSRNNREYIFIQIAIRKIIRCNPNYLFHLNSIINFRCYTILFLYKTFNKASAPFSVTLRLFLTPALSPASTSL